MEHPTETQQKQSTHWHRLLNRPLQFALDIVILIIAFVIAYELRFEFAVPHEMRTLWLTQLPLVILIQFSALFIVGVYAFIWRYIGMAEVSAFIKAAVWSGLILILMRLGLPEPFQHWRLPLSVILIDTAFAFAGILAIRVLRRSLFERYEKSTRAAESPGIIKKPVLLAGAGRAGVLAAKEILARGDSNIKLVGFVDDDPEKSRTILQGVHVLGKTKDLPGLVKQYDIDHVVITIAKASRLDIRRIVNICEKIPIKARIIPGLLEILDGSVEVSQIRDIQIEDLLGREPVQLEEDIVQDFIAGKTVMITGAGGSIGSELSRQVARFEAGTVLLLERAEFALFEIDRELQQSRPGRNIIPVVADICDEERMRNVFTTYKPEVVIHAAAHKHVPLMESNPCEAVKNNILGTRLLGEIAGENGAEALIQISTDKAVRPTSIMGASKRVAELAIQDLNRLYETRYVSVRFGNVLGSAGSVVPIFRRQILEGGPITVTHPDMVRYFMTIPEATQLVLQAGAMGEGGEIFVLDMGEPVKILSLAEDMISLSGLRPYEDIDIQFSGIRPGEKLFEELQTHGEEITNTCHKKIFIGKINTYAAGDITQALARFRDLSGNENGQQLRQYFIELIPEAAIKRNE